MDFLSVDDWNFIVLVEYPIRSAQLASPSAAWIRNISIPLALRKKSGRVFVDFLDAAPEPASDHSILIAGTKIQRTFACGSLTSMQWC